MNEPRPVTQTFLADFDAIVVVFDAVLERFETRYAGVYVRLDALLTLPDPGAEGIGRLEAIPNTQRTLGYFFERLTHAGWLEPLRRAGFFRTPPPPEIDATRGTIAYPYWTAVDYLKRVATTRPVVVAAILEEAATDTENLRVQAQLIEVMLQLRPEDRIRLARLAKQWAPRLRGLFWGEQVPAFATALARDGALDDAFELTAAILDLPDPDANTGRRPTQLADYRRDRQEDAWDLREAAKTLVPALLETDGLRALALFAAALDYHAGRQPNDVEADPAAPAGLEDFSRLWANDLGRRDRADTGDLRLFLTHVTLEAAKELGARDPDRLADIVQVLQRQGPRVIRRIELAALAALVQSEDARVSAAALPIAVDRLTDRHLILEADVGAEWAALLTTTFRHLSREERTLVLAAIQPPDFAWMQNEEYAAARAAAWRRDRLAIVADHLGPAARAELSALLAAQGVAEPIRHGGPHFQSFYGPTSPLDVATIQSMDVDELVAFLQSWKPPSGFAEASPEGLGRQLSKMIEEKPANYTPWASRFVDLAPTYVGSFFAGFTAAVRADRAFPWTELLTLAEWVVEQPAPQSDMGESASETGSDWRDPRRTLADLLGLGLGLEWDRPGAIPRDERHRVWRLIERLSTDVNPSPAYEERYGGTNMDPSTLAINTTRPEAIDAAIRYAFWVATHIAESPSKVQNVFKIAPEVAKLLERHLDSANDPSLAVRAAIGRWLGSLARTDPDWVRANMSALLPDDEAARAHRDVLWDAYVQWTQPHPDVLPVLEPYYRANVERTGVDRGTRHLGEQPDDRLAERIMTLYWWGAIPLERPNNLVAHFFAQADAPRRKHAIHFVGFSLFHTEKPLAVVEPVERLRRLWDWRIPQLEAVLAAEQHHTEDARAARAELQEFGWWFSSGAFDAAWALAQLERILVLTGGVELDHAVAERLAELAADYPAEALRCLSAVDFRGNGRPWSVYNWLEHARAIITDVLAKGNDTVRVEARALINRMVAAGHIEFRTLLNE